MVREIVFKRCVIFPHQIYVPGAVMSILCGFVPGLSVKFFIFILIFLSEGAGPNLK
jgi:hypothetical protein